MCLLLFCVFVCFDIVFMCTAPSYFLLWHGEYAATGFNGPSPFSENIPNCRLFVANIEFTRIWCTLQQKFVIEGNGNILVQKNFCKEVLDFVNFGEIYPLRRLESYYLFWILVYLLLFLYDKENVPMGRIWRDVKGFNAQINTFYLHFPKIEKQTNGSI